MHNEKMEQLLKFDVDASDIDELKEAYRYLRKNYILKEKQLQNIKQLYNALKSYGYDILSIDLQLANDQIAVEEAYYELSDESNKIIDLLEFDNEV